MDIVEHHLNVVAAGPFTLTKPVLRDAALRIVLAAGETKRPVLEQVRAGVEHPIAQVTRGVETWWMVDRAAAP